MTSCHCDCVTSNFPIQKPRLSVTSTGPSSLFRPGSVGGLPMRNVPGGHQQTLMPMISRWSPALVPSKSEGAADLVV